MHLGKSAFSEEEIKNIPCVGCGFLNKKFYGEMEGYRFYKCLNCKMFSVYNFPESLTHIYDSDYFSSGSKGFGYVDYDSDKVATRNAFNDYVKIIRSLDNKKDSKLLDIGAATGFFMQIAEEDGFKVKGLEISEYAADIGRKKGLDIKTGTIQLIEFDKESFDVVTMWDILEHIPDPYGNLLKVNSYLKKDGILALNTTDSGSFVARIMGMKWHLIIPPEHIHYFNKPGLRSLLERTGFEVIEFRKVGKKFTLEYIFHTLSRWLKWSILDKPLEFLRKSSVGKISIPIKLRDTVFVIARKK